jgi:hypothetical protein
MKRFTYPGILAFLILSMLSVKINAITPETSLSDDNKLLINDNSTYKNYKGLQEGMYYLGLSFSGIYGRNRIGGENLGLFDPNRDLYYTYMGQNYNSSNAKGFPIKHKSRNYSLMFDLHQISEKHFITYSIGFEWRNNPSTISRDLSFVNDGAIEGSHINYNGTSKLKDFYVVLGYKFNYNVYDFKKYGAFYVGTPVTLGIGPKQKATIEINKTYFNYPSSDPAKEKITYNIQMKGVYAITAGLNVGYIHPKVPIMIGYALNFGFKGAFNKKSLTTTTTTTDQAGVVSAPEVIEYNDSFYKKQGISSAFYYGSYWYFTAWVPIPTEKLNINMDWLTKLFGKKRR